MELAGHPRSRGTFLGHWAGSKTPGWAVPLALLLLFSPSQKGVPCPCLHGRCSSNFGDSTRTQMDPTATDQRGAGCRVPALGPGALEQATMDQHTQSTVPVKVHGAHPDPLLPANTQCQNVTAKAQSKDYRDDLSWKNDTDIALCFKYCCL